jgi:hypothetical protein
LLDRTLIEFTGTMGHRSLDVMVAGDVVADVGREWPGGVMATDASGVFTFGAVYFMADVAVPVVVYLVDEDDNVLVSPVTVLES